MWINLFCALRHFVNFNVVIYDIYHYSKKYFVFIILQLKNCFYDISGWVGNECRREWLVGIEFLESTIVAAGIGVSSMPVVSFVWASQFVH